MRHFLALLLILLLANGCVIRYQPAISGAQVTPLVKSPSNDLNGRMLSFDFNNGLTFEPNERNHVVRFRDIRVQSTKHSDFNYGYQLFGGQYSVDRLAEYRDDYSFFGGGVDLKWSGYYRFRSLDIGIGVHVQQVIELGEYYQFRRDSDDLENVENSTSFIVPTMVSLSPMLRYNVSETASIGLQAALGTPQLFSPVMVFQNSSLIGWLSWLPPLYPSDDNRPVFAFGLGVWQ